MTYQELLSKEEWLNFREAIIERDEKKCLKCYNEVYINKYKGSLAEVHDSGYENELAISVFENSELCLLYKSKIQKGLCYCYFEKDSMSGKMLVQAIRQATAHDRKINENSGDIERILKEAVAKRVIDEALKKGLVEPNTTSSLLASIRPQQNVPPQLPIEKFTWYTVKNLHVHHTYYQYGLDPWEYPTESLQTLCWDCHENLHKNTKIPVHNCNGQLIQNKYMTPCIRCHGAGWLPEFKHVEGGICFTCRGAKYEELILKV